MKTMTIKSAVKNESVEYRNLYEALVDRDIGCWDNINSTDIIEEYISEKMKEGVHVSHILEALEDNYSDNDDWCIWLGNSMETPTPINSKDDLIEALGLDKDELKIKIIIE